MGCYNPWIMVVNHEILFPKTQSKMTDCWYACIQILKSSIMGAKTMPGGATVVAQRRKMNAGLSFSEEAGASVIEENDLVDITSQVELDDMLTLGKALETYGPVIVTGKFAFFNKMGHAIVISGCDTDTGLVTVYDPGWLQGRQEKSWSYIVTHLWKRRGDQTTLARGTIIANKAEVATEKDHATTRARS
jgi:Papain-like cysteine protease AvrRpt2